MTRDKEEITRGRDHAEGAAHDLKIVLSSEHRPASVRRSGPKTNPPLEMRRRANIVRRYVAINLPSVEDDQRFAAELGLSVDSLLRLAAAWRLHQDPGRLPGALREVLPIDRALALEKVSAEALSAVDEARRPETGRRIEVIQRFLEIEKPSLQQRREAAAEFGVLLDRFRRIVRQWLVDRDPLQIPGAAKPTRRWRKNQKARGAVDDIVKAVTEEQGPTGKFKLTAKLIQERCAAAGLRPPGSTKMRRQVREFRDGQSTSP